MSQDEPPRLLVVIGSATRPGRLRTALEQAIAKAQNDGVVDAELIDLAERRIAFADGRDPEELSDDTATVIDAVAGADAVVFATPVYRGSMTGALKNLFDQLPVSTLDRKPVALVAMGASDHHYLGADRHLRDVLSFFGAFVIPVSVYLTGADFEDGVPGQRAGLALDELIAGVARLSVALQDDDPLGPSPLAARAIKR